MTLTIRINMDNAAFEGLNGPEVARILRWIADAADGAEIGPGNDRLLDSNGNPVGYMEVTP